MSLTAFKLVKPVKIDTFYTQVQGVDGPMREEDLCFPSCDWSNKTVCQWLRLSVDDVLKVINRGAGRVRKQNMLNKTRAGQMRAKGAPGGCCAGGLSRDLNPGPLAPEARIIPLDHWARLGETVQLKLTLNQSVVSIEIKFLNAHAFKAKLTKNKEKSRQGSNFSIV